MDEETTLPVEEVQSTEATSSDNTSADNTGAESTGESTAEVASVVDEASTPVGEMIEEIVSSSFPPVLSPDGPPPKPGLGGGMIVLIIFICALLVLAAVWKYRQMNNPYSPLASTPASAVATTRPYGTFR